MMPDIAIRVENISKLYPAVAPRACSERSEGARHIGAHQQRHDTLRDALVSALPRIPRISRKGNDNSSNSTEGSWQKDTDLECCVLDRQFRYNAFGLGIIVV